MSLEVPSQPSHQKRAELRRRRMATQRHRVSAGGEQE